MNGNEIRPVNGNAWFAELANAVEALNAIHFDVDAWTPGEDVDDDALVRDVVALAATFVETEEART